MAYQIPPQVPTPTPRPSGPSSFAGPNYFPPAPAAPQQGMGGLGGRIGNFIGNNRDALAAMSQGLLSGQTGAEQWAGGMNGLTGAVAGRRQKNKTIEFLNQQDPLTAQAVELGLIDGKTAFESIMKARNPKHTEFTERAQAAQQYGIDPNTPEGRAFVLTGKLAGADGGMPKKALTTVMLRGPDGKITVGQVDSAGNLEPSLLREGYSVVGPGDKAYEAKFGSESGKYAAENRNSLPVKSAAAQNAVGLVDAILNHPSLNKSVGPIDGRLPSFTAGARDFDERVDQLRGQAFLQARAELKGGGQITDYEGQRAEAALVRASQAKNEDDFKAAMLEFKDAILRGYQILEQQAGGAPGIPGDAGTNQGRTQSGITFTVEP